MVGSREDVDEEEQSKQLGVGELEPPWLSEVQVLNEQDWSDGRGEEGSLFVVK